MPYTPSPSKHSKGFVAISNYGLIPSRICVKVHESTADDLRLTSTEVEAVFKTYSKCLRDYTTDSRGDIGATVREAAMEGIQTLSSVLAAGTLLTPEM